MRIVLAGYYGFHNIGDDLMLRNLLALLAARPEVVRIEVICQDDYYSPHCKVSYLPGGRASLPRRMLAVARADYVIWGGGTCLYESDNNAGLLWIARLQKLTHLFQGRFSFAGIGIGSFNTPRFARLAGKMLTMADHVSFREESSLEVAGRLPGYRGSACSGGDLVFLDTTMFAGLRRARAIGAPLRSISFSGLHGLDEDLAVHYAAQLTGIMEGLGAELHFLPAHAGSAGDDEFHRRLARYLPRQSHCHFHHWQTPDDYLRLLAAMDFHIGMRLHSIICADLLGIANLAISYAPKVRYYVEKSSIQADCRVIEMGRPFACKLVEELAMTYLRPEKFITQESEKAKACIEQMFH